jgi:mono/diheme cytochrome c family protein
MSNSRSARLRAALLVAVVPVMAACGDWFTTFARQPSIHPWQVATMDSARRDSVPPRGNPQGSVPLYGESVPDWLFSFANQPLTLDSFAVLRNPNPPTDASINNGHRYYQMNCAVCHGDLGNGDGSASAAKVPGGMFPIPITSQTAMDRTDGYIFGIIRNGRILMPRYNRIEAKDRWDVVNYVRGLQGKLGRPVPTGPLGTPGETGTKIPGPTLTSPQRPAPHFPPSKIGSGG